MVPHRVPTQRVWSRSPYASSARSRRGGARTAARYVAQSGLSRGPVGSHVAAVKNLLAGLLTKAPNPGAISRRLHFPARRLPPIVSNGARCILPTSPTIFLGGQPSIPATHTCPLATQYRTSGSPAPHRIAFERLPAQSGGLRFLHKLAQQRRTFLSVVRS